MIARQEYANAHRTRYEDWCGKILHSPLSNLAKMEWAILSAHTGFARSVAAFGATRTARTLDDYAEALHAVGLRGSYRRAAYVLNLRERLEAGEPGPEWDYKVYRRTHKLPGLSYCKLSFASNLIAPFGSNVICLDTHMLTLYLGHPPTRAERDRVWCGLDRYEILEAQAIAEADEIGLAPFPYQWAVWDWHRGLTLGLPPEPHSHLW